MFAMHNIMSLSDFGVLSKSMIASSLEVQGHGSASTAGSLHASGNIVGKVVRTNAVAAVSANGTTTLTAAQVLGGIVHCTSDNSASTTLALPTAALLVAAIPGCKIGMTVPLSVTHTGAGTTGNAPTITAGSGGSLVGSGATETTLSGRFMIRITAISTPAYIVYRVNGAT
jgi:hypothetical protein